MDLFHEIPDAECITVSGGVYKQAQLYHRQGRVFAKHAGGFVRICARFGDSWGTSHPSVRVVDMPHNVPDIDRLTGEPRFKAA